VGIGKTASAFSLTISPPTPESAVQKIYERIALSARRPSVNTRFAMYAQLFHCRSGVSLRPRNMGGTREVAISLNFTANYGTSGCGCGWLKSTAGAVALAGEFCLDRWFSEVQIDCW